MKENVRSLLQKRSTRVSLTADAWSSRIYHGYMVVTGHWIDESWTMRATVLEFKRFITPHTGDAVCHFIEEVIKDGGLENSLMSITTDNASDMIAAIRKLNNKIHNALDVTDSSLRFENFHIRCIAHIVNLSVKE